MKKTLYPLLCVTTVAGCNKTTLSKSSPPKIVTSNSKYATVTYNFITIKPSSYSINYSDTSGDLVSIIVNGTGWSKTIKTDTTFFKTYMVTSEANINDPAATGEVSLTVNGKVKATDSLKYNNGNLYIAKAYYIFAN